MFPKRKISVKLNKENFHVTRRPPPKKIQEKHRLRHKVIETKNEAVRQKYKTAQSSKRTDQER